MGEREGRVGEGEGRVGERERGPQRGNCQINEATRREEGTRSHERRGRGG